MRHVVGAAREVCGVRRDGAHSSARLLVLFVKSGRALGYDGEWGHARGPGVGETPCAQWRVLLVRVVVEGISRCVRELPGEGFPSACVAWSCARA